MYPSMTRVFGPIGSSKCLDPPRNSVCTFNKPGTIGLGDLG
jgi:hypothetical protein